MDGDLLSPKRKRTGRACSLKKSNANCQITSSATHDRTNSTGPVDFQDESRSKGTESSVVSVYSIHEDSLLLDDSPLKAQRCSGPTIDNQRIGQKMNKFLSTPALNVVGVDRKKGGDQDQMFCPEYSKSTPPRSPPSLTHSQEDTTTDSISDAKKFDDTTVQSLDSPHSSSFFREAASERKRDDGAEEFDSVLHLDGSLFDKYEEHAIRTSQYSPRVPFRKGCNYGSYCESSSSSSSSSSSANKLRTASRHPIFTCPGSADLRHNQQVDDEWRSSFEAEDGESDEEEKSSNCSNAIVDNMPMKLKFRTRPLFAPDSSKSRLFQDDNDHQVMDNNMSSMALHVGKDSWKGHTKSIFDCDPVHPNDCHPKFLFRVGSKGSNLISDSSTSFMDALTTDGSDDGEVGRQSFSAEMRTPFQLEKGREIRGPEMSNFERILTGDIDDWQSSPVSIPSRDKGRFNLFSSSFSPSGNLHTPARLAGTAAASMGDLGTPVTEAGSPADIDMGASYEPYVEGDEEESGIFAYVTKPHIQDADIFLKSKAKRTTNTPNSACNVMENNGRDRTGPTYNAVDNVIDKSCRQNSSDCVIQVRNTEGDDITRLENNKSGSTDKDCTNLEVVLRPGSFDSPLVDGVPINFSMLSPRIRPDQSAFERGTGSLGGIGSVDCPSTPMRHVLNCPATPLRTPSWAERVTSYISDEDTDKLLEREGDNHITRQNSLTANRVLLSLSDTLDSDDVSFHRDFEQEGFLGSGTFADVYRARERDGKSYAVKKSKRQFRSKKDRNILMGEVMIMKKLGVAPCQHIVQLVRAWQEDGYFFVQIDLAERGTLKDLLTDLALQNSQPEDATVWHILHDVAAGLQHIHNCGVVHLDVKPANLLISIKGVIKIGDFGTAAEIGKGEDGHEGDTRYMAPELLASSDRYPSADIFSLGLTLYEACIACTPQHREVVAAGNSSLPTEGPLWHVLRDGEAPPPPDRGAALCSVILAAMHPETSERPLSEKILSLPEVLNISLKRGPNLLLDKAPKTVAPTTLARASSFLESMCTNSLQLSEAGNGTTSCGSRDKPEDDRAHTPTGPTNSSGTISFWQPLPLKKWPKDKEKERGQEKGDEKGKEKEKNTQGVCILSMSPIMEQTTPQAISSAVSHFDKKSIECSTSRECKSSNISNRDTCSTPILFLDSQSYYERSEWGTGPGPSPGELLDCQKDLTQRGGLRRSNASLSFPLPGSASSSRRRNKSYDITNNAQNSKSSFTFNLTSPSVFASNALSRSSPLIFSPIVSEGNSLTRTTPSPFSSTFPSATPNIAKHRYTDSNITSTYTTSSISVGNVFCSAGLGGYLPCSQSSMKPTGLTMRTVSKSIRRAGLETLTAGGERRNEKSA